MKKAEVTRARIIAALPGSMRDVGARTKLSVNVVRYQIERLDAQGHIRKQGKFNRPVYHYSGEKIEKVFSAAPREPLRYDGPLLTRWIGGGYPAS